MTASVPQPGVFFADIELAAHIAEMLANRETRPGQPPWTLNSAMATVAFAAGIVCGHVGYSGEMGEPATAMAGFMEMGRIHVGGGVWGRA